MKKKLLFLLILTACSICFGERKGSIELYLKWNIGTPINNSFVKDFSTSGGSAVYCFFLWNNLAIGVEAVG